MNRRRPSSRPPQPVDTVESLVDRTNRLIGRIGTLKNVDVEAINHVQNLMVSASYILIGSSLGDLSDEDLDPSDEPSRPRLNLRDRMAGDLPPILPASAKLSKRQQDFYRQKAREIGQLKDSNGLSGGSPDDYETTYDIRPSNMCGECQGRADGHPLDRNLPAQTNSQGTLRARIMCDGTRAYMPIPGSAE